MNKTAIMYAHECAPYHRPASTIGAQRPAQFAKWLPDYGWNLIVLCSDFKTRNTVSPNENWESKIISIVENAISSWDKKQSLILNLPTLEYYGFWDKIWQSNITYEANGSIRANTGRLNGLKRKVASFIKLFQGDYSQPFQPVAMLAAQTISKHLKIDVQIAEHGPDASIFIADRIKKALGTPWIVDFRDPALRDVKPHSRYLVGRYLRTILKSTESIINVTPYWAEIDGKLYSKPHYCIPNGFDSSEFEPKVAFGNQIKIWYGGTIQKEQSLKILFKAIKNLNEKDKKRILFQFRGSQWQKIKKKAEAFGILSQTDISDQVQRDDAIKLMETADVLVSLSCYSPHYYLKKGLYPGKIFEYMGLCKYVINIPGDSGQLDSLIKETQIGQTFNSSENLSIFLQDAISNPSKLKLPQNDKIERYSRKFGAQKLSEILEKTLKMANV